MKGVIISLKGFGIIMTPDLKPCESRCDPAMAWELVRKSFKSLSFKKIFFP